MNSLTYVSFIYTPSKEHSIRRAKKVMLKPCKLHLVDGATVNENDDNGWSLLIYASGEGHIELSGFLLAKGAGLDAKAGYPETSPLHGAVRENIKKLQHY